MNRRPDLARGAFEARRWRDFARLLPLLGVFLLVSPIITVFDVKADVLGLPMIFAFIYGTWALLIVFAARIARRLGPGAEAAEAGLAASAASTVPEAQTEG